MTARQTTAVTPNSLCTGQKDCLRLNHQVHMAASNLCLMESSKSSTLTQNWPWGVPPSDMWPLCHYDMNVCCYVPRKRSLDLELALNQGPWTLYVSMYIHTYIYIYTHTCIFVCICIHRKDKVYICMCIYFLYLYIVLFSLFIYLHFFIYVYTERVTHRSSKFEQPHLDRCTQRQLFVSGVGVANMQTDFRRLEGDC